MRIINWITGKLETNGCINVLLDIVGPPGSGKTMLGAFMAIRKQQSFQNELEDKLFQLEAKEPNTNFYSFRKRITSYFKGYFFDLIDQKREKAINTAFKIAFPENSIERISERAKKEIKLETKSSKIRICLKFATLINDFYFLYFPKEKKEEWRMETNVEYDPFIYEKAFFENVNNNVEIQKKENEYIASKEDKSEDECRKKYNSYKETVINEAIKEVEKVLKLFFDEVLSIPTAEQKEHIICIYEELAHAKKRQRAEEIKNRTGIDIFEIDSYHGLDFYFLMKDTFFNCEYNGILKDKREIEYAYFYYLACLRGAMMVSNIPVFDKTGKIFSTIVDLDWFKYFMSDSDEPNDCTNECLWEPYMVVMLDEVDKDFQSYLGGKQLVENGTISQIQMSRHITRNKGFFIFCHQIATSLQYQVRGNMETFIKLKKRFDFKQMTLMYKLFFSIARKSYRLKRNIYINYKYAKKNILGTTKDYVLTRKKNNDSLFEHYIKKSALVSRGYAVRLLKKSYFQLSACIADNQEFKKATNKKLKLNFIDVDGLYDTTFYFGPHLEDLIAFGTKIVERERFHDYNPSKAEIELINSKHNDRFFGIVRKK